MGLITVSLKVEETDWTKIDNGNRSRIVRDLISNYLAFQSGNIADIDKEILIRKKKALENRKIKTDTELESINSTLTRIEEEQEKEQQNKLEKEKKAIESVNKCIQCKKIITDGFKFHEFAKGKVCNTCFMSMGSIKFREWNNAI